MRTIKPDKIGFAKTLLADTKKAIKDLDDYLEKNMITQDYHDSQMQKLQATEQGLIKDIARVEK